MQTTGPTANPELGTFIVPRKRKSRGRNRGKPRLARNHNLRRVPVGGDMLSALLSRSNTVLPGAACGVPHP